MLADAERHTKPSTHPLPPTIAIEAATPDVQSADVPRRSTRAFVVAAEPLTAVGAPLTLISNVVTWSSGRCLGG